MTPRAGARAVVIGLLAAAGAACSASADRWSGVYAYSFGAGRNVAGTGMTVDYRLDLAPGRCRLRATGYQTDETLLCAVDAKGDRLQVLFKSYGDGKATNAYGVAQYKPGQPLLALERRGEAIVTRWEAYQLPDGEPHAPAVAFIRGRGT